MYSNGQTTSPTALFLDGNTFTNNTVRLNELCLPTFGVPLKLVPTLRHPRPLQATDPQSAVGGAVSMNNIITVNMTGNTFVANTAALQGGAMFAVGTTTSTLGLQSSRWSPVMTCSDHRFSNCVTSLISWRCYRFVNNTAVHDGGGAMYLYTLQDVMLSNVTFMGNSAGNQGGALETVCPLVITGRP